MCHLGGDPFDRKRVALESADEQSFGQPLDRLRLVDLVAEPKATDVWSTSNDRHACVHGSDCQSDRPAFDQRGKKRPVDSLVEVNLRRHEWLRSTNRKGSPEGRLNSYAIAGGGRIDRETLSAKRELKRPQPGPDVR